ncbi:MAG: family 16 glycosylhydrolase [Candidatus Saccharibacteria bacterium]|nr:family 16 glycosylhydrolase [Candidatus Saccharibacteria bacterium]
MSAQFAGEHIKRKTIIGIIIVVLLVIGGGIAAVYALRSLGGNDKTAQTPSPSYQRRPLATADTPQRSVDEERSDTGTSQREDTATSDKPAADSSTSGQQAQGGGSQSSKPGAPAVPAPKKKPQRPGTPATPGVPPHRPAPSPTPVPPPVPQPQPTPPIPSPNFTQAQAEIPGWRIDFFDGFNKPIEQTQWERYGWGDPPVGHGAMGVMSQRNSFTRDGKLVIRTQYENGQWSTGGAGSTNVFTASRGRWEVRAKFPRAKGIGYAFLLWPQDQGWPPEVDFAEGRVNGPQVMGVYHWDPDNKQAHRFFDNNDMQGWHTYGVIVEKDHIIFTFDGKEWGRIDHPNVTDKQMFVGFQAGAMDPKGWQRNTETVDNGVPGPLTPAIADIEIDYVAHYVRR